jgi:hypothetical protein
VGTQSDRDRWDRQNRDEAAARAAQQEAAGPTHRPVPVAPYAGVSLQPKPGDRHADVELLVREYESATAAEQVAWAALGDLASRPAESTAWNRWRDAVERTQRAARALVNFDTAR